MKEIIDIIIKKKLKKLNKMDKMDKILEQLLIETEKILFIKLTLEMKINNKIIFYFAFMINMENMIDNNIIDIHKMM